MSKQTKTADLIPAQQAADDLGVSLQTVLRWIKRGVLRGRKKSPGLTSPVFVELDSIEEFKLKREITPTKNKLTEK